jgi:hypothetical protein
MVYLSSRPRAGDWPATSPAKPGHRGRCGGKLQEDGLSAVCRKGRHSECTSLKCGCWCHQSTQMGEGKAK